ncbi:YggS family pyridoxal phosphate-dependent enzyme [Candidatus Pelagibacter sp.]|nr:YggS family pyridoxal phosphate-dependent enzyme [Candidatus Pelagibacter sp.]
MHNSLNNLIEIQKEIQLKIKELSVSIKFPKIIAVSKTHPMSSILPLINHGHLDFGENKVQEALEKWSSVKSDFTHLNLHMIGKLQSNKVKQAISLFDYIHSVDNLKLAEKISNEQIKQNKKVKLFIQINIGDEPQKSGVSSIDIDKFYKHCTNDFGLDIVGLMCLPPNDVNVSSYFFKMQGLRDKTNLSELSMGMSNDYLKAVEFQSTFLRIGSKIFGERN